ncbi:hypothetical protein ACLKA7_001964 [Drosophila subpalustris]
MRIPCRGYISTLDLKSGYWQIPMARGSREYTAFTVPGRGLFHWKVMPFGLHSAPATFQRALDSVIGPDMEPYAFAYLDDIIVSGASLEEHVRNLGEVLRRLRQANLRLNRAKCKFFRRSLVYLGHVISGEGIHTDPDKIAAVRELQPPATCRELRRCLGIASWYRRFVPNFADIVQPMSLLLKKGQKWEWKPEQQAAFEELKARLTEAPVLACPDFSEKFVLQTDASDCGLGAVLTQQHQGAERVIAYVSRRLVKAEENYSATEKECLAIVWAIRKLRCYLEGYRFDVVTDHLALKWLNSIDNPTGRIARWALELQQYQFDIHYRRGKQNVVADALSRQPLEVTLQIAKEEEPSCKWITRLTKRIREAPDRFPDFTIEGSQVYRHLGHRPEEEDYVPWKLLVLVKHHVLSNAAEGFAAKLAPKYEGPYYVRKFISPNVVRLQQVGTSRRRIANLADLKAYHTEPEPDAQTETGLASLTPELTSGQIPN